MFQSQNDFLNMMLMAAMGHGDTENKSDDETSSETKHDSRGLRGIYENNNSSKNSNSNNNGNNITKTRITARVTTSTMLYNRPIITHNKEHYFVCSLCVLY